MHCELFASSNVSEAAATQVGTIKYSLNETSRVHDVTTTLIDDVITNNNTLHQGLWQVFTYLQFHTEVSF